MFVDGCPVEGCWKADVDAGEVVRVVLDETGNLPGKRDDPVQFVTQTGVVEIRRRR